MDLSIVIPVYNEEGNIRALMEEINSVINNYKTEVIFVNDGSTDNSLEILLGLSDLYNSENLNILVIELRRNSGQTAALRAGFDIVQGDYVITMDADGQNDPNDIPKLMEKIQSEKVDVICGWRKNRKDPLAKKIPSKLSNWLHRRLTHLDIHDSGCTFRIYVAEAVKDLLIEGEDHRFLPAIIHGRGFKVDEIVVNHRERIGGKSKYGISRLWRGFSDLLSTSFIYHGGSKPLQFFFKIAFIPFLLGTTILSYLSYIRLINGISIGDRPILSLGILLEIFALQIFLTGLLAEMISNSNAELETKYAIREIYGKEDQ